jgi:hypothetical protein
MANTTPTKTEELEGLRALIDRLGPDSYLGPWLLDAFDHLEASIRADVAPPNAMDQYRIATKQRLDTEARCNAIRLDVERTLREATTRAEIITNQAQVEADNIRARAWQTLNQCLKQLES